MKIDIKKEFLEIIIKFLWYFCLFFVIIYLALSYLEYKQNQSQDTQYFEKENNFYSASEEQNISKEALLILQKQRYNELKKEIIRKELSKIPSTILDITYSPTSIRDKIINSQKNLLIQYFLSMKSFKDKNMTVWVDLFWEKNDVRWKLSQNKIKLFDVLNLPSKEFLGVFIHEFGHYIDLYYFQRNILWDTSDYFYDISWDSTNVKKSNQNLNDFVSGYALSNKYEDFAESFTFYVLFNEDFLNKTTNSPLLYKKYMFFRQYVFNSWEFSKTDFFDGKKMLDYNRDTTKISYNLENFLNYLKKLL